MLRFFDDMTEAQAADVLGCSIGAVKTSGSRGLAKLRAAGTAITVLVTAT